MQELCNQAEAANLAVEDINKLAAPTVTDDDMSRGFAGTQALLGVGAMVSKLLWPNKPQRHRGATAAMYESQCQATSMRGQHIRAELGVVGEPILEKRDVRNAFEHFDERLDRSFESGSTIRVDRLVGSAENFLGGPGATGAKYLRVLNPNDWTVSVLEERVSIQELYNAIQRVGVLATEWLGMHGVGTQSFGSDRRLPTQVPPVEPT